jgi:hypothetical protein
MDIIYAFVILLGNKWKRLRCIGHGWGENKKFVRNYDG